MQSFEVNGLEELIRKIEKLCDEMPERRRRVHEALGQSLKAMVDSEIAISVNDSRGKIRSWQEEAVGSGGGYAAVRPIKGETGANSPGAITNALENGHRIRPAGQGRGYRPRIKTPYVNGRHFYAAVRGKALSAVMRAGQEFCDEIAKEING